MWLQFTTIATIQNLAMKIKHQIFNIEKKDYLPTTINDQLEY